MPPSHNAAQAPPVLLLIISVPLSPPPHPKRHLPPPPPGSKGCLRPPPFMGRWLGFCGLLVQAPKGMNLWVWWHGCVRGAEGSLALTLEE